MLHVDYSYKLCKVSSFILFRQHFLGKVFLSSLFLLYFQIFFVPLHEKSMRTYRTFAISLALCLPILGTPLSAQPKGMKTKLRTYFLQRLEAENNALKSNSIDFMDNKGAKDFDASMEIKSKDIKKYQDLVWNAWKEANAMLNEEKLIPLDSLSENSKGAWNLPETLEPHAVLPYYYGTKLANTTPLPFFLYIHGSGPKNHEWSNGLKLSKRFDDAPCIYFIPQIPNEGEYYRWWQKAKQYTWEKLLRLNLVSGNVDANRIYVFGISEGGYGSQRLASFYADYWAAAGPMAGGEPLKNAPVENCANIGFSLLTGAEDTGFYRNKLMEYIMAAFDSIEAVHPTLFRHRIELIPHRQHHIDYTPTTPWLKTFTRNPYPKTVMWEDYAMDGRHRNGFYNLQVIYRPASTDADARTYYEMNIKGNTIDMKVSDVKYETVERDSIWGIELKFARHYHPSTSGKIKIYLNDNLADMSKPIKIIINGKTAFEGKVKADIKDMANSCVAYFDPCRIYPASVDVEIK